MFYDRDFLVELDKTRNKTIYARVTSLTFEEAPVSTIEGRVSQGSINLDGASAVRRSCSLTIVAQDFNYSDYSWGLNTKFKLEVGVKNTINAKYPEIIWFPQGIYLITSFNTARSTNNFTITLQGKDKMCLLNGEVSGSIGVQTDFGTIEEEDADGIWTIRPIPIPEIIKNIVHVYGGEPYHNIIIKDLNTYGLELLEYRYENNPLILYRLNESSTYTNIYFLDSDVPFYEKLSDVGKAGKQVYLKDIPDTNFDTLIDTFGSNPTDGKIYYTSDKQKVQFLKLNYGDTAGYRMTDLTYAGDLIANVGEAVTSVLDKIKNMLVEFEYFYDLDGHFVFQKKQSFTSTLWSPNDGEDGENESIKESLALSSATAYEFNGGELITSFNNNPNLLNLRNDFSIWGERKGVSGAAIPIHLRYAIDVKPKRYTTIQLTAEDAEEIEAYNDKYGTTLKTTQNSICYGCEYEYKRVLENDVYNPRYHYFYGPNKTKVTYEDTAALQAAVKAGIEQYNKENLPIASRRSKLIYWDYAIGEKVGDWREILYIMASDYFKYNTLDNFELRVRDANPDLYPSGRTGYEQYYTDIQVCWRQLYDSSLLEKIRQYTAEAENFEEEIEELTEELLRLERLIVDTNNDISEAKTQTAVNQYYSKLQKYSAEYSTAKYNYKDRQTKLEDKQAALDKCLTNIENYYYGVELTEGEAYKAECTYLIPSENYEVYTYTTTKQFNADRKKLVRFIGEDDVRCYWNRDVYENPGVLNYWFDFLDSEGELSQFSVRAIGARTKAINETTVKSIYFRDTPNIIFEESSANSENQRLSSYRYIQIPQMENMFSISSQGKSAKERLDELLYAHAYCSESATVNAIPIYYLQPNTRVHIADPKTKLEGDYIVSKITIPLSYNGTMSLTTTKAAETVFL